MLLFCCRITNPKVTKVKEVRVMKVRYLNLQQQPAGPTTERAIRKGKGAPGEFYIILSIRRMQTQGENLSCFLWGGWSAASGYVIYSFLSSHVTLQALQMRSHHTNRCSWWWRCRSSPTLPNNSIQKWKTMLRESLREKNDGYWQLKSSPRSVGGWRGVGVTYGGVVPQGRR